jgi:hypothetical protein
MRRSTGSARLADGFQDACVVLDTRFLKALPADCRSSRVRDDAPAAECVLFTAGLLAIDAECKAIRIVEYKDNGRNLVVARRALVEEKQQADAAEVRRSLVLGAVVTGRVISVHEFGAFVGLGAGVQRLS